MCKYENDRKEGRVDEENEGVMTVGEKYKEMATKKFSWWKCPISGICK